jgi:hypothetical protein
LTWSKEPTDWAIYLCGVGFIVLWVLLAEALVIFLPERIYLMHLRDAEARPAPLEAEPGKVIIKMTEQEAAEMQEALAQYARLREGHMRGGETNKRRTRQDTKRLEAASIWKSAPPKSSDSAGQARACLIYPARRGYPCCARAGNAPMVNRR